MNVCSDTFNEMDEDYITNCVVGTNTILGDCDPHDVNTHTECTFTPCEGQVPLSMFREEDTESLLFPKIFCGKRRPCNWQCDVNIQYSHICKYELHLVGKRATTNIPNSNWKKVQMK